MMQERAYKKQTEILSASVNNRIWIIYPSQQSKQSIPSDLFIEKFLKSAFSKGKNLNFSNH